jgi:hypothetical protein
MHHSQDLIVGGDDGSDMTWMAYVNFFFGLNWGCHFMWNFYVLWISHNIDRSQNIIIWMVDIVHD